MKIITDLLREIEQEKEVRRKAVNDILDFVTYTYTDFQVTDFHRKYYRLLQMFAEGKIKRLIISMPPQHGKSEGSSRRLPAYMLGKNPKLKIALVSYNIPFARKFNRTIQRIMVEDSYINIFPKTLLNKTNIVTSAKGNYLRNADEFEVVGNIGGLKVTGVGGSLTGEKVDILIMDDLYKDYADANSPVYRQRVIDWYTTVATTRLHNESQELIVFTRWHEEDLVGYLEQQGRVIEYKEDTNIDDIPDDIFLKLNFEAIKETEATEIDPRQLGEPLWAEKHSIERLLVQKKLDPQKFQALYQGNPTFKDDLLYSEFRVYYQEPYYRDIKCYIDVADQGEDYLCSIIYGILDENIYILDVIYTQVSQEVTENLVINQINKFRPSIVDIESNNGGRGFARVIGRQTKTYINDFYQSDNKESRIITNSAEVNRRIVMPSNWNVMYKEFYEHVTKFRRKFNSNKHDDAPDVLTGLIEFNSSKSTSGITLGDIQHKL